MSINTLISPSMVLALAMRDVVHALPADADPFEITAEFELPDNFQLMTHDEVNATVLRPAIEAAMAARRPWGGKIEFGRYPDLLETFAGSEDRGIVGRFLQVYDFPADRALGRIDIRVPKPGLLAP